MTLFGFFKKKKVQKKTTGKSITNEPKALKVKFDKLEAEMKTVHLLLQNHDQSIAQHSQILETHTQKLEELVVQLASNQPKIIKQGSNNTPVFTKIVAPEVVSIEKQDKLNFDSLSGQERKILNVFFQHSDMALSYADIGSFLEKSPNTIKNQLRQLRIKADLFSKSVDSENRNRFRLKDQLQIEKYLKLTDSSSD